MARAKSTRKKTDDLSSRITSRKANIGVVGLGYVGLPLSLALADAGFKVTGFDISTKKIKLINSGKSDIDDVSDAEVKAAVKSGRLIATTDWKTSGKMDVITICVPTPLSKTKDPDVSFILSAVEAVRDHLKKGALLILESTTYPGTTEELILPTMEEVGLHVGRDFHLAFSPERIDPGNKWYDTKNTPRIVGGVTPECSKLAREFYNQIISEVIEVSTTRAAEMVKLLENTFRSVNIALVNEVALMCDRLEIDVWEIIDAAATKPFGFMPFYPGPGLGGHCIPIDPHYLSWKLKSLNYYARFIELAGDINSHMPEYVVQRISLVMNERQAKAINKSKILVLGVAYKADIKDIRESPALDVIKLLEDQGAKISYNDPFVPEFSWDGRFYKSVRLTASLIKKADITVIVTNHSSYNYQWIVDHARLIFDTRNATKKVIENREKIVLL